MMLENQLFVILCRKNMKKMLEMFVGSKKCTTFATAIERESNERKT